MNAFLYRKILTPRRLRIEYTSPGICEGDFTSTGRQEISLLPLLVHAGPTGLIMEPYFGNYRLQWNRVPGALCYSIYRLADELDPNSPFILVAECLDTNTYEAGAGIYCVTALTPEGETECSNRASTPAAPPLPPAPPYVPDEPTPLPDAPSPLPPPDIPGTCGDGDPPVPASFLVDLDVPEEVCRATAVGGTAGTTDFTVVSGQFAVQYLDGWVWDDCTLNPTPGTTRDASIAGPWFVHDGDIQLMGKGYGCFGVPPAIVPPDCTPPLVTQIFNDYPDGMIRESVYVPNELIISPSDDRVGTTATFHVPGSIQSTVCVSGGTNTWAFMRVAAFIPQPTTLTVNNFAAIKNQLFCVTGADIAPQWNGVIDDACTIITAGYQCAETNNGEHVGDTALLFVDVRLEPGVKWTISIIGQLNAGGGGPYVTLFSGEKRYGQTAHGNYGRNGGCSTLGCITLV